MRVAITHTRYLAKGGVERYAWDLVKRLLDAGHEVHYFCHFWDDRADPRVHLHRIPNPWKQIRFMKVWSFDRWLNRRVRREDWDVVHGFSKSSYQDIYTDGSGSVFDYQGYSIEQAGGGELARKLRRASLHQRTIQAIEKRRFTRGNFARVIAMSELAAEQIRRRYALTAEEVVTIYNGIDTERFHPANRERWRAEYRERTNTDPDAFVVLCVANDYRRKGVPTLIEAARRIKEQGGLPGGRQLRIAVIGKERRSREQKLIEECKASGVLRNVKFYGPQDLVERWFGTADLLALPSHFDAFGNVVLEALATGVPALVSRQAGAAEVIRPGENGFVLDDPTDAGPVVEHLMRLAGDAGELARLGQGARATAEHYSWDRHFEQVLRLYEEVAESKRRAGIRPA